jgi:hypothetical protein
VASVCRPRRSWDRTLPADLLRGADKITLRADRVLRRRKVAKHARVLHALLR